MNAQLTRKIMSFSILMMLSSGGFSMEKLFSREPDSEEIIKALKIGKGDRLYYFTNSFIEELSKR